MHKSKKDKLLNILLGFIIGSFITIACFITYSKIQEYERENFLVGGWVIPTTEQNDVDPNTPHSLNFNKKTVTITTVGDEMIECSYSFDSNGMDHILKIYDFPGVGDIELYISLQPHLHIKNSGTILDGQYLFAG